MSAIYYDVFIRSVQPKELPTMPEWADEHRIIAKGAEKGPWKTDRTPYAKEIMYELSPHSPTREIIVIKPTQMGFTEIGVNTMLYYAHLSPIASLMILHTQTIAETTAKNRINPAILKIPDLRDKISPSKRKGDGGPDLAKEYPDGYMELKWGQTPSSFASIPAGVVICDDIDRWPTDVGEEGNPLDLARGRTETYANYKFYANSTPTTKAKSNIYKEFNETDKRHYYMPCPECTPREHDKQNRSNMVIFEWKHFKFEHDENNQLVGNVDFCCPHCGSLIREEHKEWMMSEEAGAKWIPHRPGVKKKGYRITGMYQPLGMGRDWNTIGQRFIDASKLSEKGDNTKLKTVINTIFAEVWDKELTKVETSAEKLHSRRYTYSSDVPEGVFILHAGVDTQDDRFEYEVVGYGKGGQSWGIERGVVTGDPALPETKMALDEVLLNKTYIHESGSLMKIHTKTVDYGGHRSKAVSEYTSKRFMRRIFAIKGSKTIDAPVVNKVPTKSKYKTKLFMVGVNAAKDDFFSRLVISEKGDNYCHFPDSYDMNYFEQLLVERREDSGRWINPGKKRNESTDCRIYADCAKELSGIDVEALSKPLFYVQNATPNKKRRRILSKGR
ncbi:phage terminase large subunit family protein [Sulfurovum sp. zt1-1]|uniref:Phage terminase large subunit family protein n=1 Tax=Sulfurovum zhangzhouensis TaxID=3019067 RepID=A0ABT7R0R7_9BACT|nr:terminase gpA endonuclease subunit [Sulfurovum zhangzhouensis]MDM5272091.1 phage terminase large subunit family protein [Sulfurovum zhangzhouensis]